MPASVVMFSDLVFSIKALLGLPPASFVALLPLALGFWFLSKLFRSLVLQGSLAVLGFAGLVTYGILMGFLEDGQVTLAMFTLVPAFFIGREVYRRLLKETPY